MKQTIFYGAVSAALYAVVFDHASQVAELFSRGGYYAALPIATVFVFSFAHGTFAGKFWSVLGIEAKNQGEINEGWQMVLSSFDKISHIVKDILYCAKPREPNFQIVRPNDTIREVYELFRETGQKYSIDFKLDLDNRLGEAVIDPAELYTVLSNLVSNAMDACKLDIWKDTHLVEIRSRRGQHGSTIIEVADNGVGIDKDLKDHVFEDFFSSKGDKGTGLGLMVTQKIMREHGGNITFRSRPGQGTAFVVTFPHRELKVGQ